MIRTYFLRSAVGLGAVGVLVGAACRNASTAPVVALAYAAAMQSCGPADGPAVAISFSDNADVTSQNPSYPLVRVMIWRSLADARGHKMDVSGNDGFAVYLVTAGTSAAGSGFVTLDAGTNAVTGTLDLTFPNRGPLRGRFTAVWLERAVLCG